MKKLLLSFFGLLLCWASSAQVDSVSTHLLNGSFTNGQSGVAFEVESTQPINITGIKNAFYTSTTSASVWYRIGGVKSASQTTPNITTADGWVQATVNGPVSGNGNSGPPSPIGNFVPISIPANTAVGIYIEGQTHYDGSGSTPLPNNSATDGTLTVRLGQISGVNYGFGGGPTASWFYPRYFEGVVFYELGIVGNCSAFSNFSIDSISATAAKVNWTPGTGNSSFYLEYGPQGFVPGSPAGTKITGNYPGTQPPVVITGLNPVTQYDVYIGEICNSGADSSYFPSPQQFQTTVTCPAPFGLADSGITATTVNMVWNTVTGDDFILEWGPTGFVQGTGTTVTVSDTTGYMITGLSPLGTYDIYIVDSCGPTDQSAAAGPYTITTGCFGPLSGTYTLNPGTPMAANNFISLAELKTALGICGVGGPLTVEMVAGVFNEQVEFNEVVGASATNTITIKGNGTVVTFLSTDPDHRATLELRGADYFIIDSLTIRAEGGATGEYGVAVRITDSADYNTISNCTLIGDTTSTSSNFAAFTINGSGSTFHTSTNGASGNYNLIENNTVIGGYYGLVCTGQFNDSANGNILRNNVVQDFHYMGMYLYYNDGIRVEGNDISRPNRSINTTFYGMYMYAMSDGTVMGNRVHDPRPKDTTYTGTAYGMYMGQFNGTAAEPNLVANNLIYNFQTGGAQYGFYPSTASHTRFLHNSIIFNQPATGASSVTYPVYMVGTLDNIDFQNNLVYLNRGGGGTKYLININGTLTPTSKVDNNAYYATASTSFDFGYSGGAISSFAEWQQQTDLDSNSFFVNPFLTDILNNDFTPRSAVIDGLGEDYTSLVATDIDGSIRTVPVDPGALEFSGAACTGPNGLNVSAVTSTSATISWNTNNTSYTIEWGPVGFRQASITPNVINVASGGTSANLTGLSPVSCYDFYIVQNCSSPIPGAPPEIGPLQICTDCVIAGLNGSYTIGGPAGPNNFATLDSAVSILNSCGVLGPVTFNMSGGVHNAIVLQNVDGASATNTITFNGSAAGDSIIATGVTAAVELDGARHFRFNNLYMENMGGNYVLWLHDAASDNAIDNCVLMGDPTATSSATAVVAATNSATTPSSSGLNAEHFSLTNSRLVGNYYGVSAYGTSTTSRSTDFSVENCMLEDQYYYGIRVYYHDTVSIQNNYMAAFRNTASYGVYSYYNEFINVSGNIVEQANTYGMYSYYTGRYSGAGDKVSVIANNMFNSDGSYGLYTYGNNYVDIYHNTLDGSTYGLYISGSSSVPFSNLDVRNNLITNDATGAAIYVGTEPDSNFTLDYNGYYTAGSTLAIHGSSYATLAAYQSGQSAYNANSVSGDPVYVSATDLHILGTVVNDVGDNSVGITVDVDGDTRPASGSTVVDIGADEYTPVSDDLALINGMFLKNGKCLGQNDTIMLQVQNIIGATKNFSTTALTANYTVTGPVNTSGSVTVNSGTLAPLDTLDILGFPVDLSIPGLYTLNAWIDPSTSNQTDLNDTLVANTTITIYSNWEVEPDTIVVISNTTDTVELKASSPFFGGSDFFITEICHFAGASTGSPVGGTPSWLGADDYIEITGVPGSDLGGFTLEQWGTSSLTNSHTFPAGTLLSPNGTAIIAVGSATGSTPSPSNFYYHSNVTSSHSSGSTQGRIIKDPSGNIVDAVGYGPSSYTFPAAAGVTTEWTGGQPSATSTWGIRLQGADLNSGTNWLTSSSSSPQDPNVVNTGVQVPVPGSVQGFSWSLNGNVVDTVPAIVVGPYSVGGVYNYIASFSSPCGVFTDTVTVIVNLPGSCPTPTNLSANAVACDSVIFSWNSAADSALVTYVISGATPAAGNLVIGDSSFAAVGLSPSTDYDFYVANICGSDTSMVAGPITVNSGTAGAPMADFNASPQPGSFQVNFDASPSFGERASYDWDFGDGNMGSGKQTSHSYAAGGSYNVKLTVTNACGVDDTTITVADVSLMENSLSRNLRLFPNPVQDELRLELSGDERGEVIIRISDLSAKEVIRTVADKPGEKHTIRIDVAKLPKGVYMLEVSDARFSALRRFVKD